MEENECIVCLSCYDDDEYRPRVMPCGHSTCSKCLETAIRGNSKKCPTCRKKYSASSLKDIPINFSLESMARSMNTSDKLPECTEHQFTVSHRCSTHKAWICKSCIKEDHSSESCKIISITEQLNVTKSTLLEQAQPLLSKFEEACKKLDDHKKLCKQQIDENEEELLRYETLIKRLQEEMQIKTTSNIQMEKNYAMFDQKLENLKCKRSDYDKAVISLQSSVTIKGVSKCSVGIQNEAEKLQLVSHEIENEVDLMLQSFNTTVDSSIELPLGDLKLSVKEGRYHLHAIRGKNPFKSTPHNLQFSDENDSPLTGGILTFMDIAWPNQSPRRVYMKMLGNTARARQHILLVTGICGHSYRDLQFMDPHNEGQEGDFLDFLIIRPYDDDEAEPLLTDVTVTDIVDHEIKVGLMAGAGWNDDCNNGLFGIYISEEPGITDNSGFGQVTSGIEVLQDIARSKIRDQIKIVDCGVVVFW